MSQVLLSPRAYDDELMSELTEQAVLEYVSLSHHVMLHYVSRT